MKLKLFVAALAVAVTLGAVPAHAGEKKLLYFNPEPVAGFGITLGRTYAQTGNAEAHVGCGATLFSLDKAGHIGLFGVGTAIDFYDYSLHPAEVRDLNDGGFWGLSGHANWVGTIIPIRIGPLAYQFSWNGHVKALGVDRGGST